MTDKLPAGEFSDLTESNLDEIIELIEQNQITVTLAAKFYGLKRTTFISKMKSKGKSWKKKQKSGRIQKLIPQEITEMVVQNHKIYKLGATKTYYQIVSDLLKMNSNNVAINYIQNPLISPPSHCMVRKVFRDDDLYKFISHKLPPVARSRYDAKDPNLIWCGNVHFLGHN